MLPIFAVVILQCLYFYRFTVSLRDTGIQNLFWVFFTGHPYLKITYLSSFGDFSLLDSTSLLIFVVSKYSSDAKLLFTGLFLLLSLRNILWISKHLSVLYHWENKKKLFSRFHLREIRYSFLSCFFTQVGNPCIRFVVCIQYECQLLYT